MLERAGARLWVWIAATVIVFPVAAVILLAAWVIRVQIARPMLADPSPVTLAATAPISPAQEKVEAATSPQRVAPIEPVALPPQARTSEPSSTAPILGEAASASADRFQDAFPSAPPMIAAKPAAIEPSEPTAGAVSPMPAQVEAAAPPPATVARPIAPAADAKAPDTKAPEFASALTSSAPLAVAPPRLGDGPAYADPTQDTLPSASPTMPTKLATPQPVVVSPMPAQVEAAVPAVTAVERVAPALEAKAPGFASALSMFATFAVAPPRLDVAPAYADPTQDTSPSASPTMAAKPAALKLSRPISGQAPQPAPKPHVTVARISSAVPLPRPRPTGNNPPHARP